jgi:hypothetical protein
MKIKYDVGRSFNCLSSRMKRLQAVGPSGLSTPMVLCLLVSYSQHGDEYGGLGIDRGTVWR